MSGGEPTPVLVGAGQVTQREPAPESDPVALMAAAARRAADDAGGGRRLLLAVDTIAVPNVLCWPYANPARVLAERLGIVPQREIYTAIGGNTPQMLVAELARRIATGTARVALVAGAEMVRTVRRAVAAGMPLAWPSGEGAPERLGDDRDGGSDLERTHGLSLPVEIYPLFENALRAASGWSVAEHRHRLGALSARLAAVAATHPQAWSQRAWSADEIATPSAENRMIAFPYPKRMTANIDVDQGAAVLLTSVAGARALGLPEARRVHLHGAAEAHDRWLVCERGDLARSPAIAACARAALAQADVTAAEIDAFDLYSCFPSAVQVAAREIGLAADDPRPLTVTGGLPYFGGPCNDYALHAIASMMDRLRERPGTLGMVTAVGWYLTKHAVGIYGTRPPAGPWAAVERQATQREVDGVPGVEVAAEPSGPGTVETYTVVYDRDGEPARGSLLGRLADGRRFVARLPDDRTLLGALTRSEGIGLGGHVAVEGGVARFFPG